MSWCYHDCWRHSLWILSAITHTHTYHFYFMSFVLFFFFSTFIRKNKFCTRRSLMQNSFGNKNGRISIFLGALLLTYTLLSSSSSLEKSWMSRPTNNHWFIIYCQNQMVFTLVSLSIIFLKMNDDGEAKKTSNQFVFTELRVFDKEQREKERKKNTHRNCI